METRNLKSMSPEERKGVRELAFQKYLEKIKFGTAAKELGVQREAVYRWYKSFDKYGKVIDEKKRGPKEGSTCKLNSKQRVKLVKLIVDKDPAQLKFNFALWTSRSVKELILREFKVKYSNSGVRRLLRHLGFSSQCPNRYAREQNPQKVKQWLEVDFPAIKKQAQKEKAKIFFADEAAVQIDSMKMKGYSLVGQTPTLRVPANRGIKVNMISAVSNKGELMFMTYKEAMNADLFKGFVEKVYKEAKRKVFLIVDNLKVHHAKCLDEWKEKSTTRFRIFYLPSYSPERNPDEYMNRDVKANISQQKIASNQKELEYQVQQHLEKRKKEPEKVKGCFKHKYSKYAE